MDPRTMQRMRDHITESEGTLPFPYKDTKGKLTVGTGFLVDDEKSFVSMPFRLRNPETGEPRPATEAEKKAEFKRAKGLSDKQLKTTDRTPLSLPESETRRRLDAEITTRVDKVKKEVGEADWNRLTDGQKTAVVDIHYANGSLEQFPKLKEAIRNGDAKAMAEQSDFHVGISSGAIRTDSSTKTAPTSRWTAGDNPNRLPLVSAIVRGVSFHAENRAPLKFQRLIHSSVRP